MPMNFTNKTEILVSKDTVCRINQDGTVILMKMDDSDFIYKINGVAGEMYQMFHAGKLNLGDVVTELAANYQISPDKILSDAQEFLKRAHDLKFISCR
jgi:hypothetical protein